MPKVVIEVPEEFASVGEAMKKFLEELQAASPETRGGRAVDFAKFERAVSESTGRLEREALRRSLQALDVDCERVVIRGKVYAQVGRYEAPYKTKAGPVMVLRSLYREVGQRNAPVVDPVSLRAGVVEDGWLPDAAKAMAYLVQQGTSREAEMTARQLGRLPYSRSSFERIGHAVGGLYEIVHADVEDVLIEKMEVEDEAASISIGLDRVSVPMEEPREKSRGRPRKDAPARPVDRVFRMAYVGTVTLHDKEGNALKSIRYGRMPQGEVGRMCESMIGDVAVLLRNRPALKLVALTDGAPEMRDRLRAQLAAAKLTSHVHEIIDFWHVVEKLAAAAAVMFAGQTAAALRRWKLALLNKRGAVWPILEELQRSRLENVTLGEDRPVHDAITYLTNHGKRMNYAGARKLGLPIGSGNTEATCKSLFEVRMKRSGARWKEQTGEHVVQLRALALSERWDDGIDLMLRELRAAVRAAA